MQTMGALNKLTLEQKLKAFQKASDKFGVPDGKLVLVTEEYYDGALELFKTFVEDEPLNAAVGLKFTDEYKALCLSILQQHVSLMIVHEETGEPIALRANRIISSETQYAPSVMQDDALKKIEAFLAYVDDEVKFFEKYKCTEAFHFYALCVTRKFRRRGFATKIFEPVMDMIRNFELGPVVIRGEGDSNYSKKVYEKHGFETLHEIQYCDYLVNGKQVICNTGEHQSMKTYAIKL